MHQPERSPKPANSSLERCLGLSYVQDIERISRSRTPIYVVSLFTDARLIEKEVWVFLVIGYLS